MNLIYTKSFDSSSKKLKKHHEAKKKLKEILEVITSFDSFEKMKNDPILQLYDFERLKHQFSDFYSFKLSGVIRLIVRPTSSEVELDLIYVSMDHYEDFDVRKVEYYDE